ncbi:U32 family peptidase, partial [Candidatus Pacearchaeota archaeon]|nr:U32 family peptidase [Candidatus Pacearchaeota archaeon]
MIKASKYELLAPAGNFAMLVAAVNAGADAIYFGLNSGLGMRANAKNFDIKDLKKMREICNKSSRKPKLYLTLNTIVYDSEIKKLEKIIKAVKGKVDAIICWDPSVISLCKKYKVEFHISTQASVSSETTAKFYKKMGAKRVVLARELNLKQIKRISKILPVETFVHGAMCVAVSGRCFMSQHLFGISANRGECIQPCRRTYIVKDTQEGYELKLDNNKVMSAKDMCTLPFIDKLKKAGIVSFKIEGRNRDPRYVDTVVRMYRKAIDKKLTKTEIKESIEELKKVYNREFSSGFYLGLPTSDDFATVEHSAATEKKEFIGKVIHYFKGAEVATIKLVKGLKVGDNLAIIGNTTGIEKVKVESMEIERKKVKKAKAKEEVGIK